MSNLPTNPTKADLLERYWFKFLQFCKRNEYNELQVDALNRFGYEFCFWTWYVSNELGSKAQQPAEAN